MKKKNNLIPFDNVAEVLMEPGDEISLKMTKTRRLVGRINTKQIKMTQTMYPTTGTIVRQQVFRGN